MAGGFVDAFVPLFVATDVIGVLPLYLALTQGLEPVARQRTLRASLLVGAAVSLGFALLGRAVFALIGITVEDFLIAGGLVLVGIAVRDLVMPDPRLGVASGADVGVVPIGVPLLVGPAVITTTIVLVDLHGATTTIAALLGNLAVAWAVLARAALIERLIGRTGARAFSKVVSLFLTAIGVQLVRRGLGLAAD